MPVLYVTPLMPGNYYHVYNRAVSNDQFFTNDDEYHHFLMLWQTKINPIADTFAYCLLPNHFHFLIRIKEEKELCRLFKTKQYKPLSVSRRFGGLFSSYANSFNHNHQRMGKLFMLPFRRKEIDDDDYFTQLVYYIHRNPYHHNYTKNPTQWRFSSYSQLVSDDPHWVHRKAVLEWFGGRNRFIKYHSYLMDLPTA